MVARATHIKYRGGCTAASVTTRKGLEMTNHRLAVERHDQSAAALPRRECLKALGVAGLTALGASTLNLAPSVAAPDADLRAKFQKNVKLGIHTAPYQKLPLAEAARRLQADGFHGVLTNFVFADVQFDPAKPDWDAVKKVRAAFDQHGIHVAALWGYYNVVDPDAEKRKRGEARMQFLIENWRRLGCNNISTETGTLNAKSEWLESPDNATEATFVACRDTLARLAAAAEKTGAVVSIEAYWRNVIDSIERAARLFKEVKSPALRLVMDPCNYFRKEDLPRMQPVLEEMFSRLGERIVVAHAKDVKAAAAGTDLPAAGLGVLDYPLYLRLLARLDRPMDLLIEHLGLDDVARARDYVLAQAEKI